MVSFTVLMLCLIPAAFAVEWHSLDDKEYYIDVENAVTHSEAVKRCGEMRSVLATVHNERIHEFLKATAENLSGSTQLWIGLLDLRVDDNGYMWSDGTGFVANQSRWVEGIPNQTLLHCVHTITGTFDWKDDLCSASYGYVCQRKIYTSPWIMFENWDFLIGEDAGLNFDESSDQCVSGGGTLIMLTNQNILNFITSNMPPDKQFWIGLKDERVWSDGSVLQSEDEIPGVSPLDSCFVLDSSLNFQTRSCQSPGGYICQREHPDVWIEWNDTEYLVKPLPEVNQGQAALQCASRMAQLVSITTQEEYLFVRGLSAQTEYFTHSWIGLKNYAAVENPSFVWHDFSSLEIETWWNSHEPSAIGRCVISDDHCMLWNVTDCNLLSGFICERPLDPNDCLPNPCLNRGICVDELFDFSCLCTPGYNGKDCSVELTPGGVDLLSDSLTLSCSLYHVTASFSKSYIDGLNVGDVNSLKMLNNNGSYIEGCESVYNNANMQHEFDLNESFGECSASRQETDMFIVVNYIVSPIPADETENTKILLFDCTHRIPNDSQIRTTEFFIGSQQSHLSYSISRYESSLFANKQLGNEISEGERVYVGITLNIYENSPLVVQGLSCWITDNLSMDTINYYYVLDNGCPVDDPMLGSGVNMVHESHEGKHVRFSFLPFTWKYPSNSMQVLFVSCSIVACLPSEDHDCSKDCSMYRKRRSVSMETVPQGLISFGPLVFKHGISCADGNSCSHHCFVGRDGQTTCNCPYNMYLLPDKHTCAEIPTTVYGIWLLQNSPIYVLFCLSVTILLLVFIVVFHMLNNRLYGHVHKMF